MEDIWVPVVAILAVFGLPVGAFIVFRVLAHRERMEMIRHGLMPQAGKAPRFPNPPPAYGPAPVSTGISGASVMLGKGIRTAFVGLALTIGLSFIGYNDGVYKFGAWMLGGLIPLFVGLSQITIAYLSDPEIFARFRGRGPGPGPGPYGARPPYPEPPLQEPGNGSSGSYTYRPGGTQELRPPTSPPTKWP